MAHGKAVEQGGERAGPRLPRFKPRLVAGERFGMGHGKGDGIIAKARIKRIGQTVDPFAQQAQHQFGIAGGGAGFDGKPGDMAIAAGERQGKGPPAEIPRGHLCGKLAKQIGDGRQHRVDMGHRFGKAAFGMERRGAVPGGDMRVFLAQQPGKLAHQCLAEPRRQRRARLVGDIANAPEAGAAQRRGGFGIKHQRRQRQGWHVAGDKPRHGPCGIGRAGQRAAGGEPETAEMGGDFLCHCRLAAEQMRAAGAVDQQRGGPVGGDRRAVAGGEIGQPGEQGAVATGVMRDGDEGGQAGACLGQTHADFQPRPRRRW